VSFRGRIKLFESFLQQIVFPLHSKYCKSESYSRSYTTTVQMLKRAQTFEDMENIEAYDKKLLSLTVKNVKICNEDYANEKNPRNIVCSMIIPKECFSTLKSIKPEEELFRNVSVVFTLGLNEHSESDTISGKILSVESQQLVFKARLPTEHLSSRSFTSELVWFEHNKSATRACLKVLDDVAASANLLSYLGDLDAGQMELKTFDKKLFSDEDFKWSNPQIGNNLEQQTAIKNIVNRTAYPLPYVIFGPPGNTQKA
jgi:hypothetical protein